MKIAAWILGLLLVLFFVFHQLHINNAFIGSLDVKVDTSRAFAVAPGDTVVFMLPLTNNSWHDVLLTGTSKTCNVKSVDAPDRFVRKRIYNVPITILAPEHDGEYAEAVVMRTDGYATFYGSDIVFNVDRSAQRVDTLWMGRQPEHEGAPFQDV